MFMSKPVEPGQEPEQEVDENGDPVVNPDQDQEQSPGNGVGKRGKKDGEDAR